jgi:hypothetical protein
MRDRRGAEDSLGAALLVAALLASGCATTPVSFQPRQDGAWASTSVVAGAGVRSMADDGTVVVAYPTFRFQGAERPAFTLRVANASAVPLVITRDDVRAFFRDRPAALYTRAERAAELRADATRREAVHIVAGTLAAVAALWGISTGWDGVISAGGGSLVVQTPLTGWAGGVAIAAASDGAIRQIEHSAASEAVASGAILESLTVAAGASATVHVVLKDCCSARLSDDDVIRLEVTLAGRTHAFSFQRVVAADPTRLVGAR